MKKWLSVLAALIVAVIFSVPVFASGNITTEDGAPDEGDEVIVVYDWETGQPVGTGSAVGTVSGPAPIDIRMEMVGEVPYITRYYEMESEIDLAEVPQGFDQDGYRFARHDTLRQEVPATVDTKEASKTEVVPCESEDIAKLMETADKELAYDENGYTGTLTPDVATIRFEEGERTSYSYTLTETREYPGLPANDASYIDKTITKNGVTLHLDGIEWEVSATSPTEGGLVPTLYKGIAFYSGRDTGSKVASYTAYITYTGQVSKTTPGVTTVAVIYRGEVIPVVAEVPVPEKSKPGSFWIFGAIAIVLLAGAVAAVITVKKRGGFSNFSLWDYGEDDDIEDEYEVVMPTYAAPAPVEQPISVFDADRPIESNASEQSKADTAASILSAIEGMEDPAPKPRRRASTKKEPIPLVEKVED